MTRDDEARFGHAGFLTDSSGQKTTIPGVGFDTFLQRTNSKLTGEQLLRQYIAKHGRRAIADRWREIWRKYKERVYWDERDRCFRLKES
jgi:hypothetical protein